MNIQRAIITTALTLSTLSLAGCFTAAVATGAAAGDSAANNLTFGTQIDDLTIKAKAVNTLNNFPQLTNKSNVEIVVFNHIVLILGQVPEEKYKKEIAEDISKIKGVKVVYNKLTIGKPVTMRTYAHDSWITTKVKAAFIGKVNPAAFNVVTEDGVVYLLGLTTHANGDVAARVASRVSGVKEVVKAFFYVAPPKPAPVKAEVNSQ